ncbi:MAG: hypothetical protein AAGJ10_05615 [Bacteroidota bacterium]
MYDERAIRAVLQRAAELEQSSSTPDEPTLSREEVLRLGQEAGISATAMQQAVDDVSAQSVLSAFRKRSSSKTTSQRLAVPMTDAVWRSLVEQLRARFNAVGTVYHIGVAREWHYTREREEIVVAIRPDSDGTRVTAYAQRKVDTSYDVVGIITSIAYCALAFTFDVMVAIALGVAVFTLVLPFARRHAQTERLAKRLADVQAVTRAVEAQHTPPLPADLAASVPLSADTLRDA